MATATRTAARVLPWRRHQLPASQELAGLTEQYQMFHPRASMEAITRAYEAASVAHRGQTRKSGEPYITHPLAVATIVARYGVDEATIVAALLHDAVEDTEMTRQDVADQFGEEVALLVDGVTKLDGIHFDSKQAQAAASMRKLLVAMAQDLRVLVIKLADRLHNMRTLAALPHNKQARIAKETFDIYAPLAHRMGMNELKQQLEDLCFAALHPKRYAQIDAMVADRAPEREIYLTQVEEQVRQGLAAQRIEAQVQGRPKHLWSIYEKMMNKGRAFEDIFDLVGIRIVVDSVKDCYGALGVIHGLWKPVQGRFKDYIAQPKFNLYQSLHTTVVGPQGKPIEVQIRTTEMHKRAESGVAAHYSYKDQFVSPSQDLAWLGRIVDFQQEVSDPDEFMAGLKTDLEFDEVFVLTPKGEVVTLPHGATPVDFAYQIHTEVGHRCIGARVDGKLVPLDTELASGSTVEIFTSKTGTAGPKRDWLEFVVSRSAQSRIRQWFSRERREDALEEGRELFVRALRRESLPVQRLVNSPVLVEVATALKFTSVDAMLTAIGEHHLSPESVATRIAKITRGVTPESLEIAATPTRRRRAPNAGEAVGVQVEGHDDVMVRMARCCAPVPGDEIQGFVTRGRGVSIHRTDCANFEELKEGHSGRLVEVYWSDGGAGVTLVAVEIKALDRGRLLQDVSQALSDLNVNILRVETVTGSDRVAKMRFVFEIADSSHFDSVLGTLRRVESVYDVRRADAGEK